MAKGSVSGLLTILGFILGSSAFIINFGVLKKVKNSIKGGLNASEGQFPYQVCLIYTYVDGLCGGSILNNRWILTAAGCVKGTYSIFTIVAGISDLNKIQRDHLYNFKKVIVDEHSELALINTIDEMKFSKYLNKINLPPSDLNVANMPVIVSGWSLEYEGERISKKLKYTETVVLSLNKCQWFQGAVPDLPVAIDRVMCTLTHSVKDLCNGYPGDPVVSNDYQIGVVLYRNKCAIGFPDMSINIWHHVEWIKKNINDN